MNASKVVMKIVSISFSILVTILIVLCLYQGGRMAYDFGYRVFTEQAVDTEEDAKEKVVQISSDMSARDIGALLEKKGLVRSADLFAVQLKLSSYSKKIKAGVYTLSTSMTAKDMMQVMSADEVTETETEE